MNGRPHPWVTRAFTVAAAVGILGWMLLLGLWGWWTFQPVALPTMVQPIQVMNPGNAVAINDPLIMRLEVTKPQDVTPVGNSRYLECQSGNLVALVAPTVPLPVGVYTVVSDSLIIPAKVTPGDTCRAVFAVTYAINPIRNEVQRFTSEPFTVLPAETDTLEAP